MLYGLPYRLYGFINPSALYGYYATEEDTRESIAEYIRVWEFDARLKRGPDSFRLEFENSEIVDRRNPTPEAVRLRGRPAIRGIGSATLTVSFSDYPSPPSDIALNADVEMMHQRYLGYAKVASHLPAWPISVLLFSNPRRANRSASEQ